MSAVGLIWVISGIFAFALLPVGAIRMVAYRSEEVDHTPALRLVARLAIGIGAVAFVVFAGATGWFLLTGRPPV